MKQGWGRVAALLASCLLVENLWLAYPAVRDAVLQAERDDVRVGREAAERLGCFNCHGPAGKGGLANPGSEGETVPSFHEGTPMMFVSNDQDIREYILDGAPAAKRQRASYRAEMEAQAIQMPAYRGWVGEADVNALVAYVRATSDLLAPAEAAVQKGAELARKNGCFSCHGEMGGGGLPNPGALKSYIPGFIGNDFRDLVRSDEELVGWIRDGTIPRLATHPVAKIFLERQRIQMPAYKAFLSEEEISAIAAYVRWLAAGEWRTQALVAH
jgi:mono/diheme cytochrome c family protein